jgi:hypothetical protein
MRRATTRRIRSLARGVLSRAARPRLREVCTRRDERDWRYARNALRAGLVTGTRLFGLVDALPVTRQHRDHVRGMLETIVNPD